MSEFEVEGFLCQRKILQFQLESIPQLFFQIYLLIRIPQLKAEIEKSGNEFDEMTINVSVTAIGISVCCALIHIILETLNLSVEASVSDTSFSNYMVACYNAR